LLAKRIIPCLDVKRGRVVKGVNFLELKDAGDPIALAAYYEQVGADELVLLDIEASVEGRETMLEVVRGVAEHIFIPFTVGGGIRSIEDIRQILTAGADKISLNTAAIQSPSLIEEAAKKFGRQCIVIAIDAKQVVDDRAGEKRWEVYSHGGRKPTGLDVIAWAKEAERRGAGEILLTSIDADGTQNGYDLALYQAVVANVEIPVIASGGAGTLRDFGAVLTEGKADAVLAASVFHYGLLTIGQVKDYLVTRGVSIRR